MTWQHESVFIAVEKSSTLSGLVIPTKNRIPALRDINFPVTEYGQAAPQSHMHRVKLCESPQAKPTSSAHHLNHSYFDKQGYYWLRAGCGEDGAEDQHTHLQPIRRPFYPLQAMHPISKMYGEELTIPWRSSFRAAGGSFVGSTRTTCAMVGRSSHPVSSLSSPSVLEHGLVKKAHLVVRVGAPIADPDTTG